MIPKLVKILTSMPATIVLVAISAVSLYKPGTWMQPIYVIAYTAMLWAWATRAIYAEERLEKAAQELALPTEAIDTKKAGK